MTDPPAADPPIASPGPGPTQWEEPPIAPPRPRRSHRSLGLVIAAVAIVATLVMGTVLAAGLLSPPMSPSPSGSGGISSSSALSRSETTATSVSGGPWVPRIEAGFASTSTLDSLPSILLDHLPGCSISLPASFHVPASPSEVSTGGAAAWIVGFTTASQSRALLVLVNAQASVALALLTGTCVGNLTALPSIRSADAVDASRIAAHYTANISAFVTTHHSVTAGYFLGGIAVGGLGALFGWALVWTTCPTTLTSSPVSGFALTLLANAETGSVITGPTIQTIVC
ncbi:MAG: hypothetical protein ACYCPN_06730 [Thermoplasmata archaeon]